MHTALIFVFTSFSLVSFLGVLWGADPYSSDLFIRVFFFVTLFFTLAGLFALLHLWISALTRRALSHEATFRRGFLLAALSVSFIALETISLLNLVNAFAIFLVVVAVEMTAVLRNPPSPRVRRAGMKHET